MIDQIRLARELSWAASKNREVAAALSRIVVRLTSGVDSDNMSAPRAGEQGTMSRESDLRAEDGVIPTQLSLEEQNEVLRGN